MELPKRKHPRLKEYNYSQDGFYYVTIHSAVDGPHLSTVGRGLAPAETVIDLTSAGKIAQEQLHLLQNRYSHVRLDKYVIMPTHIHMILRFFGSRDEDVVRPSLTDVIGAYKSITTRVYNQFANTPGKPFFQTSFYEQVLRSEKAYQACWQYIEDNPLKWSLNPEDR